MSKDEALKMVLDYEFELPERVINACKEALESQEPDSDYVFVCKHCGDKLGIKWDADVIGQVTINPKEEDATDNP